MTVVKSFIKGGSELAALKNGGEGGAKNMFFSKRRFLVSFLWKISKFTDERRGGGRGVGTGYCPVPSTHP